MERHLWYHSFKRTTNNLLLFRSTVTDRVLTWCPYYSYEVQTCIISSHEKLGMKISSWRFYLVIEKCDLRQSANASNNSNLNFGHRCKRIFKCLNQFVMTGFFFPFFVPGLILKTKPYQDVRPRAIDFSNSFSTSFFTFVRKVMMIFLTKTVFPILPISPHDVISFLHPFGQQDKRNGR